MNVERLKQLPNYIVGPYTSYALSPDCIISVKDKDIEDIMFELSTRKVFTNIRLDDDGWLLFDSEVDFRTCELCGNESGWYLSKEWICTSCRDKRAIELCQEEHRKIVKERMSKKEKENDE